MLMSVPDMRVELRISVHAPCISAGLMEYFKKGNLQRCINLCLNYICSSFRNGFD